MARRIISNRRFFIQEKIMNVLFGEVFSVACDATGRGVVKLKKIAPIQGNGEAKYLGRTFVIPRTLPDVSGVYFNKNTHVEEGTRFRIGVEEKAGAAGLSRCIPAPLINFIDYVGQRKKSYGW
jgi:hypothetical protein